VELDGEEDRRINRSIHLKYLTPEALSDPSIASYISEGDDVTIKVHIDDLIRWNLAGSKALKAFMLAAGSIHLMNSGKEVSTILLITLLTFIDSFSFTAATLYYPLPGLPRSLVTSLLSL
jgi:hypothetical protein